MKRVNKSIPTCTLDLETYEDTYCYTINEFVEMSSVFCLHNSPSYQNLADKTSSHNFSDLSIPLQEKISEYESTLSDKLFNRSKLLYEASYLHCGRAINHGDNIDNILLTAYDEALMLLDNEDPFGNVEIADNYKESAEDVCSFDFSDLPDAVITRILELTTDIINEQTYLSALMYYMGCENCLRTLEKWGVLKGQDH